MPEDISQTTSHDISAADISQQNGQPTVADTPTANGQQPGQPPNPNGGVLDGWFSGSASQAEYANLLDSLRNAQPAIDPSINPEQPVPQNVPPASSVNDPGQQPQTQIQPQPQTQPSPNNDDDDDEPENIDQSGQPRIKQIKFRPRDEVEASALRIAKATGKPVTSLEVINAARVANGLPPIDLASPSQGSQPQAQPQAQAQETQQNPPPTDDPVTQLEQELETLRLAKKEAQEEFDFDKVDEAERKMEKIRLDLVRAQIERENREKQQAAEMQQSFHAAWHQNFQRVVNLYPDAANPNSPLVQKARELQEAAKLAGDPIYSSPSGIYTFFTQAALDMGIAPTLPTHAAQPSNQPSARAPLSTIIGGGNPAPAPRPADLPRLESADDYTALIAKAKGIHYGGS